MPFKFTGKIDQVTIDIQPSNLSDADKKAVEDAEKVAPWPAKGTWSHL